MDRQGGNGQIWRAISRTILKPFHIWAPSPSRLTVQAQIFCAYYALCPFSFPATLGNKT
jgi:hypothetical protein